MWALCVSVIFAEHSFRGIRNVQTEVKSAVPRTVPVQVRACARISVIWHARAALCHGGVYRRDVDA